MPSERGGQVDGGTQRGVGPAPTLTGLRTAAFATMAMLAVQFTLGTAVNLLVAIPNTDHGLGLLPATRAAIVAGPTALAVHVVLGLLLVASAIAFLLRAVLSRHRVAIASGTVGLLALLAAMRSGAAFVATGTNRDSLGMALDASVAMLAYAFGLWRTAE